MLGTLTCCVILGRSESGFVLGLPAVPHTPHPAACGMRYACNVALLDGEDIFNLAVCRVDRRRIPKNLTLHDDIVYTTYIFGLSIFYL